MGELETTTIVGIGGFAVGLVFGAVVQRTNFCTMGAISDLVLMGDGRRFRAWVLAIAVAIIGTQTLHFGGVVNINKSLYLSSNLGFLGATLGGAMFGFGMTSGGWLRQQDAGAPRWRQSEIARRYTGAWHRCLYDLARPARADTGAA